MNSVLNDLTYCDGRFDSDARATFSDSPSRLKLRSNTFQGIQTSLEKRRMPVTKKSDFFIPSAALPEMQTSEGNGAQGGVSASNNQSEFTYRNLAELETVKNGASKKLKVGPVQLSGVTKARDKNMPEPVIENVVQPVVEEVQPAAPVVPEVEPVIPTTEAVELPKAELPNVQPIVQESPVKEPVVENTSVIPEPVKEEVSVPIFEQTAVKEDNKVEEQVDDFSNLQKVTEQYQQVSKEYDTAKQELDSAEKELASTKEQLQNIEREISDRKEGITNQQNVIDTAEKDIVSIQEETKKVKEEIRKKIILIDKAREKKAHETREVVEQTKRTKDENSQYRQGIDDGNKQIEDMKKESETLTNRENQVLSEKEKVRSELEKAEEILKAITLPEDAMELENEMSENSSIEMDTKKQNNFIPFDTNVDDEVVNKESFQKSYGAYKAA